MFDSYLKRDYRIDLACSAALVEEAVALDLLAAVRAESEYRITKATEANCCCSLLPAQVAYLELNSPYCC